MKRAARDRKRHVRPHVQFAIVHIRDRGDSIDALGRTIGSSFTD